MSTNQRIRGRALQRIRQRFLRANPLCMSCYERGYAQAATQLDHIIALVNGGTDTQDNRQGLCDECHEAKTRIDLGLQPKGCDANGLPLDAAHHWRA